MKERDNVLVTGGAGYIGSHTCKELWKAGYQPVVYDNLVNGHSWAVQWGPIIKGDLADRKRLDSVIDTYSPIGVMHFAAYAYVGESMEDPGKYYRNNVAGSLTLLESIRDHNINNLIFSSTCSTYGIPARVPITEQTPQVPINPYGMSKLMIEQILADFNKIHGLEYISLRYFNAAGADLEGDIGEKHDPETHLIPLGIKAIMDDHSDLTVYGTDYPTPDGSAIRDYIHVTDLANAHILALEYLINQGKSLSLNLGTGQGYSVLEVIEAIEDCGRGKMLVKKKGRRLGDPPILIADASKAMRVLKWIPKQSGLENIVKSAWNWHQKHS